MALNKLCIAYPHNGPVAERFLWSMVNFVIFEGGKPDPIIGSLFKQAGSSVAENRTRIVKYFMDETSDEWLLQIDSDIEFPPELPRRMLDYCEDNHVYILGAAALLGDRSCVFYKKREDGVYDSIPELKDEPYELDVVGTGMILIHRTVLHAMRNRYKGPWPWFGHDPEGDLMLGTDFTFCRRAAAMGFKLFGHGGMRVNHYKYMPVPWGNE